MPDTRRKLGQWGEDQARGYLEARGCQVVAANWRCTGTQRSLPVRIDRAPVRVRWSTRRGLWPASPPFAQPGMGCA